MPAPVPAQDLGLPRVDFLKVDVERAELEVLKGVSASDWSRIGKVVCEVHDIDGALEQVQDLLRATGRFRHVHSAQADALQGTGLFNVFARE